MSNRRPVTAAALLVACLLAPYAASAQTPFIPYFGKNQIR